MTQPPNCPKCGATVPPDSPGGVCPRCVLELGWAAVSEGNVASAGQDPGPTSGPTSGFVPPEPGEIARHFPQLEILELLGRGGMGAVYKARQKALDRIVAVKVLPPEVGRDASFAERFTREARALARLGHPNIVAIHDVGQTGEFYYFVMEFVDGANLRSLMQAGSLTPAEALAIVPQVCEALQYAHDEGIVHRDIKPENILIDKKGRVKIADFGLAKLVAAAASQAQLTGTYQVMGTFHYMAPEQFERPQEVDHRADIYSLGVVLYELLTRELPIGRFSLPSQKVQVDVRLDDVVLRALEKDPPRRYQHASDVKTDVDTIVRSQRPIPPVVLPPPPAASPATPDRTLSVPISVPHLWGGLAEGHGVLRFDGEELLVEFDMRDSTFKLRVGSHHAALPLGDVLAMTFLPGWWSHSLKLQASRFQALARLPGCDRGQLVFSIGRADRRFAEKIAAAVTARQAGDSWNAALAKAESLTESPAPGEREVQVNQAEAASPAPVAPVVAGGIMVVAALVLLALAFGAYISDRGPGMHKYLWVGIGLFIGGSASVWAGVKSLRTWVNERKSHAKPGGIASRREQAQRLMAWPALGLMLAGVIDLIALLVVVAIVGYLVWGFGPPPNMTWACATAIIVARLACAPLQLIAALGMMQLEKRRLAMLASLVALIPASPAWLVGLPMGLWALVVLRRESMQDAFDARATEILPSRPWAGMVMFFTGWLAALGFVAWTYATLPGSFATSNRPDRWVSHSQGQPRLTEEFVQRLELRPQQVQAVNDLLESAYQDYRKLEVAQARLGAGRIRPTYIDTPAQANVTGKVDLEIGPFPTRLALLETRTRKQIDLVLDERQRGLARQCDLFSDLFFAGRGRVRVKIIASARPWEPSKGKEGPAVPIQPNYTREVDRDTWFSGTSSSVSGPRLPLNLQAYWNQVTPE